MRIEEFEKLCKTPGQTFDDEILHCLYLIKRNKWNMAHNIAQDIPTNFGSYLHGLLHRIEGDNWNAGYWYRQAEVEGFQGSIENEWRIIATKYLQESY